MSYFAIKAIYIQIATPCAAFRLWKLLSGYTLFFASLQPKIHQEVFQDFIRFTRKHIAKLVLMSVVIGIAASCATVVTPTGGPKDEIPPALTTSEPKLYSTNFSGNRLVVSFNEYVALKDLDKYLLVSPPLSKTPDVKIKGKSVVVKLQDTLRKNTTYNFYFGNSIVDITESNPFRNFNFAFSTGPTIDSLSLGGVVTDAFTRLPAKEALVMLYSDFSDSVPRKQLPLYVSRADEQGKFRINRISAGIYRLVALKDENSNYLYDLPNEQIAFISDSVTPTYSPPALDTNKLLTAEQKNQIMYALDLFSEPDSIQRLAKSSLVNADKIMLAFRFPSHNPKIEPLEAPDMQPWCIEEWNSTRDTLQAWLLTKPDTLKLRVTDIGMEADTVVFAVQSKQAVATAGKAKRPVLRFTTAAPIGVLGFGTPMEFTFANPVKNAFIDKLGMFRVDQKDTVVVAAHFTDSIKRHLLIDYKWGNAGDYKINIPKDSFTDIYGNSNDSSAVSFKVKPREEYGTLAVNLIQTNAGSPLIVQLLGEKDVVVRQIHVTGQQKVDFGLLQPGKYRVKVVLDKNANGKWDTGVFSKNIQPETVLIHPKTLEVRANWELEEEIKL